MHCAGFMRFNPAALHFMRVQEVPLAPDAASVGLEIRVIGNDSGEKVCCSPSTQCDFVWYELHRCCALMVGPDWKHQERAGDTP